MNRKGLSTRYHANRPGLFFDWAVQMALTSWLVQHAGQGPRNRAILDLQACTASLHLRSLYPRCTLRIVLVKKVYHVIMLCWADALSIQQLLFALFFASARE